MKRWMAMIAPLLAACNSGVRTNEPQSVEAASVAGVRPTGSLAMGNDHGCALGRNGSVYCWGYDYDGELGDGANTNRSTPFAVPGLSNQVSVSAGNATSCSVGADGTVHCWGLNTEGQIGNGTTLMPNNDGYNTPQLVIMHFLRYTFALGSVVEVAVGGLHVCARDASGDVWCWGDNVFGQLGNGTTTNSPSAIDVASGTIGIAAGSEHTCALLANHTVECWGSNGFGQLGNGTQVSSASPVTVPGLSNVVALSAMEWGTCALIGDGTARCWGNNGYGQMGNGTIGGNQLTPALVSLSGISSLARGSGGLGMCATLANGRAACWGYNGDGETGSGTISAAQATPIAVGDTGGSPLNEIAIGLQHACARSADGNLWCWGLNSAGQLGNGTTTTSAAPVYNFIPQWMSPLQRIAATAFTRTACIVTSASGEVECWGIGEGGELGDGQLPLLNGQLTPVFASGLSNVIGIVGIDEGFEALRGDGTVWCWGENLDAECAAATAIPLTPDVWTPSQVVGIANAVAIGPSCAVLANGTLWCWGSNVAGQLGNGTTSQTRQMTPVQIPGLTEVVAVAGSNSRCALRADGTVWCWGVTLAGGTQLTPTQLGGISNVVAITGNYTYKCALRNDGTVWCWGTNSVGELGNGTVVDSATPVQVTGISNAVAVVANATSDDVTFNSEAYACAILVDGTVRCWGGNDYGQLGNGTTSSHSTPVVATGVGNALQIAVGQGTAYALTANGTLWTWGDNVDGELGLGTSGPSQTTPAPTPITP